MIRKKSLRLLLCDYQRTIRYYTIYRAFKSWSSDDFTTILRLFYWRNYDYCLRLFQKLLRLFQPERYDYCSPLLAIGRKSEKSCGESRQLFRAARRASAAGLPRREEGTRLTRCALTADPVPGLQPQGMGSIETPPGWHGLRYAASSYIPYYNRAAELTCTASWRDGCIWYALEALRRCDTLQRGASGVIVDCIGLVSAVVEWGKSQEKRL